MIMKIMSLLVVQAYWLSIVFIGLASIICLIKYTNIVKKISWDKYPIVVKFLLSLALGFVPFCIITAIGYIFKLPEWALGVYFLFLAASVVVFVKCWREYILPNILKVWGYRKNYTVLASSIILLCILIFDFVFSIKFGNFSDGDTFTHVSKVMQVAENGFTLVDKQLGAPVIESRYHVNVIHTIYAVPVWLGLDQWSMWRYTLPFMRIVFLSAIFFFSWYLLSLRKDLVKSKSQIYALSVLATGTGAALLASMEFTAGYPNHVVYIWLIMFVVGVFEFFRKNTASSMWILVLSGILLAFTHPTYSVIAAIFLASVIFLMTVFNRSMFDMRKIKMLVVMFVILLSTAIITKLVPNQQGDFYQTFELYDFDKIFGLWYIIPRYPTDFWSIFQLIVEILGMIFIYFKIMKTKTQRIVTVAVMLFVTIFMYFPPVFTLTSLFVPKFLIRLFVHMGVIWWVAYFFGVLGISYYVSKYMKKIYNKQNITLLISTVIILCVTIPFMQQYGVYEERTDRSRDKIIPLREELQSVLPKDKGSLILADLKISHMIPSVSSSNVVMTIFSNSSPGADRTSRTACQEELIENFNPSDLKKAGVKYIVYSTFKSGYKKLNIEAIESSPYIHKINESKKFTVYEFSGYSGKASKGICDFNE